MVVLERQDIVGALGPDLLGDLLLAAHRVERHDAAFEPQDIEQLRDGRDLVRLAIDRALAERQPAAARPGADQVQRALTMAAAARPPHRLAVHRHHLAPDLAGQGPRPSREARLERVRIEQHEDPPEGVVRGDAVRQRQEGLQPRLLAPPVELNVLPALGTSDHRAHRDCQDVDQLMIAPARRARISEPGEARR